MDIFKEMQKVKAEVESKHGLLTSQMRSEIARFSRETRMTLNELDEKINERIHQEISKAFSEIKTLIQGAVR